MSDKKTGNDLVAFALCGSASVKISAKDVTDICRNTDGSACIICSEKEITVRTPEKFEVVISKLALAGTPTVSPCTDTAAGCNESSAAINQPIYSQNGCHIGYASSVGSFEQDKPYVHRGNLSDDDLVNWLIKIKNSLADKLCNQERIKKLDETFKKEMESCQDSIGRANGTLSESIHSNSAEKASILMKTPEKLVLMNNIVEAMRQSAHKLERSIIHSDDLHRVMKAIGDLGINAADYHSRAQN
ncbi:hypothetical protein ERD95_15400 [Enterobacteriaceae bacterium ML5]|nr:hypothetical protein ERD95_15400 [Enterobacteriaceae bacterium ML5]